MIEEKLSHRVKHQKPSPTLVTDAKAKALKAKGADIVNLSVGEPDFDTPEHIKNAAINSIKEGFTKYTAVDGIEELKLAVISKFKEDFGIEYKKSEVMVSTGAKQCLYNVFQAILNEGDEVIIPSPYWVSYPPMVELAGGKPVYLMTDPEDGFRIHPEKLDSLINTRTKAIILNSPSNPTGTVLSQEELKEIAEITKKRGLIVVSDDIYDAIRYDGKTFENILNIDSNLKDQVVAVNGVSKTWAMTGWRIGFMAGPEPIIKACSIIQSQSTSNPTSIAQKAALAALTGPKDFVYLVREEFRKRRDYTLSRLQELPLLKAHKPLGAFYIFVDVSRFYGKKSEGYEINNSIDMANYLLEMGGVAVVAGVAFGDDRFIRISYATNMDNLIKGMNRFINALSKLV